jgi:transcriptional regulator with XRE-family HTH domain
MDRGLIVRTLLKLEKIPHTEISEGIGKSKSYVAHILTCRIRPTRGEALYIADRLGLPLETLFDDIRPADPGEERK